MVDYDLSKLNSRSFEHLVQSLAAKSIGPGIVVFGDGPDGGREATFDGEVPYSTDGNPWDGYGVFQAKFLTRSRGSKEDGDWAIAQLDRELAKYSEPKSELRIPDYFVFATNVVLTAVKDTGSKDKALARLEDFRKKHSLQAYDVWDYDKIRVLLDNNDDVRRGYAAFVTAGDVLSQIIDRLNLQTPDFGETLCNFLQKELLNDEFVRLGQAGYGSDDRIPLARVFVDLHTRSELSGGGARDGDLGDEYGYEDSWFEPEHAGFIKQILTVSAERLDPRSLADQPLGQYPEPGENQLSKGRFVLIGGPGQGKTTVGQFVCQIFRASIISQRPPETLSLETKAALKLIQSHCEDEGIDSSLVPRFPFRIVLNEFASALSGTSPRPVNSVYSYLAQQIHTRTEREVSVDDIKQWLAHYPSLVIFDGLDEVPSSSNRDQVLESIREFWVDADILNADVLAIATSRPQGYNEDFSPAFYEHQSLVYLDEELGHHFAERLVDARYGTDADRKRIVLGRLERAFDSESTSHLMGTPLQVTIMTALVDRMGQPPEARWNLFKAYYDVIYQREVERNIPASELLRSYKPDINAIHNQVALLLQIDSERTGLTDAKLSSQRFIALVDERLKGEGHNGENLENLKREIVAAAVERLVFLVGLESDQVGFEIRSLQEFMAAESLMEGGDEDVEVRLREIAPIPNWRNVFLFASGKCFADRQHLRDMVLSICTRMNERQGDQIAGIHLAGSGLAIELLDDGLSRHQPKYVESFARIAIRALDGPNDEFHEQLASIYEPKLEQIYFEEITRRLHDRRNNIQVNAWNCLLRLVGYRVKWAQEIADEYWPSNPEVEVALLRQIPCVRSNRWAANKVFEAVRRSPVTKAPELARLVPAKLFQDAHPFEQMRSHILRVSRGIGGPGVNFIGGALRYFPAFMVRQRNRDLIENLAHLEDWHPSWGIYKSAAKFIDEPTKECLAQELRELAPVLGSELQAGGLILSAQIPWPLAACLEMCSDQAEMLDLANKADSGVLGGKEDWAAAEGRWAEKGITFADVVSMSDDRLPFDANIGMSGFPIGLPYRYLRFYFPDDSVLRNLFTLHSQMPKCVARSFIARAIHRSLSGVSYIDLTHSPNVTGAPTLESILDVYDDVPSGSFVSSGIFATLADHSAEEIASFFSGMNRRGIRFQTSRVYDLEIKGVKRLVAAFNTLPDKTALLPIVGAIAESGYLAGEQLNFPDKDQLDSARLRADALLVKLRHEPWGNQTVEEVIDEIQEIALQSPEIFTRVMTTIRRNQLSGPMIDDCLVELERFLPKQDYVAVREYGRLLNNSLRRRKSGLNNPSQVRAFNLPSGVVSALIA